MNFVFSVGEIVNVNTRHLQDDFVSLLALIYRNVRHYRNFGQRSAF